ncbi:MAG: tetratricopeptide repeat protein [Bacteroidales bacterium]|nr:tetratricopeptide repeat protein [Bacteroidales bacterium]
MRRQLLFGVLFGAAVLCSAGLQAQNAESYESLMRSGNTKFASNDFISAKTYYEMALKQRPNDTEARKKLDQTLVKIQQDSEKQEIFYAHLDAGDALNAQNKYEEALEEYNKALAIFPDDKYVGAQAETIRGILKERSDKQEAYNTAIAQGNNLLEEENFDAAIMQFEIAKDIFPNDNLPKERIAEAKRLQSVYNEKVSRFNNLMEEANNLSLRKNFDGAIQKLNQALEIFPNDSQAQTLLQTMQSSKATNDAYNAIIAEADQLYESKAYKEAKTKYQNALSVVAGDAYATEMLSRLDPLIAQQDAEEAARIAAEQEAARLAAEAEAARLAAEAEAARIAAEQEAARLAAEEAARKAAEEEAARLAAEAAAAAEAERQAQIQTTLGAAEGLFAQNKYVEAKAKYQEVFTFDEGNATATAKIAEIDGILAQIAADEEAARIERERIEALRPQYNAFIKEGDKQYASKTFDKAVEAYAKAEELNIGETYPTEMIERINKIIEDNKLYELNTEAFTMTANTPRRFTFNPVDVASRRSNYVILKARNLTPGKSFPMIVSFGGDGGKNGGFVLAISESEDTKTYIFRIGGQYKWFSENNNWIELISENDDVEVSLVMISRSN